MFNPKTIKIEKLGRIFPDRISELENLFKDKTIVYIDYGNIFRWAEKLNWKLDLLRTKQLFESFPSIVGVKIYYGVDSSNPSSVSWIKDVKRYGYEVISKEVKKMSLPIDVSGIERTSPSVLSKFIDSQLLSKLTVENIQVLNDRLSELNKAGTTSLLKAKCNFDVEIALDMVIDAKDNNADNFILWSGDSDFFDAIVKLRSLGKNIILFNTARRVSHELSSSGVYIYEINKIRNFICWNRDMQVDIVKKLEEI